MKTESAIWRLRDGDYLYTVDFNVESGTAEVQRSDGCRNVYDAGVTTDWEAVRCAELLREEVRKSHES